ncbi:hypothetical protein RA269_27990, partial [Pseudomonas syringae pv. tagetis]|uniref:hypothetical protein n=1 Tax=Pseudomonas syringae group genomosp. 7 TaxID=251699 RepID=UPI00376FFD8E
FVLCCCIFLLVLFLGLFLCRCVGFVVGGWWVVCVFGWCFGLLCFGGGFAALGCRVVFWLVWASGSFGFCGCGWGGFGWCCFWFWVWFGWGWLLLG